MCINPSHNGKVAMWCSECFDALKAERDAALLQNDELRGLAHTLNLFVGVYEGRVLDKDAAKHLLRKYAKWSEAVSKEIIEYQDERDKFKADLEQCNRLIERLRNSMLVISEAWPMDPHGKAAPWEHCVNEIHDEARRALKETEPLKRKENP